ncbi:hypothetical protein FA15DRAFT_62739 [Coprinopsis marcescibilis]|uniref:Secreted protein n=1 Tax=Coprinopsis marcescibilis TaxID=230819 RepID=A0A5C3KNI1_COPMA|nr:hypothetical protein FA15DRAFT_62739 [Coprinopsis marcescibilis]
MRINFICLLVLFFRLDISAPALTIAELSVHSFSFQTLGVFLPSFPAYNAPFVNLSTRRLVHSFTNPSRHSLFCTLLHHGLRLDVPIRSLWLRACIVPDRKNSSFMFTHYPFIH